MVIFAVGEMRANCARRPQSIGRRQAAEREKSSTTVRPHHVATRSPRTLRSASVND